MSIIAQGTLGADGKALAGTGNILLQGAQLSTDKGAITLTANNNIDLALQQLQQSSHFESKYQGGTLVSTKSNHQLDDVSLTQQVGNSLSGDSVALRAGKDLTIRASTVVGTNDVTLTATTGNVTIT
jgi:filamentous hemagglutinin